MTHDEAIAQAICVLDDEFNGDFQVFDDTIAGEDSVTFALQNWMLLLAKRKPNLPMIWILLSAQSAAHVLIFYQVIWLVKLLLTAAQANKIQTQGSGHNERLNKGDNCFNGAGKWRY